MMGLFEGVESLSVFEEFAASEEGVACVDRGGFSSNWVSC